MASAAQSVNFDADEFHTLEPLVTHDQLREKIRKGLHLHVGRSRRYSVEELSVGSGVPQRLIRAAMAPINDENFRPLREGHLASVAKFLGASFASMVLEPMSLGAFQLMDGQPPLPSILTAESAKPAETPREKVERLHRELIEAIEEMKA